jgi:hypothetical protein
MLALDPETREHLRGDNFDRVLRGDPRINVTARLGWLMTALSHRSGYASMKVARMAAELGAAPASVRQARQKLVRLGLFTPGERWRYSRVLLSDENSSAYWCRIRADRRLDLTARCTWLLCDATRRDGSAEMSLAEIGAGLGVNEQRAAWAVHRVRELRYFTTVPGGGRGHKTVYARVDGEVRHCSDNRQLQPLQEIIIDEDSNDEIEDLEQFYSRFERRPRAGRAARTHAAGK